MAIKSGSEFRHDNNWIFAAQLAGERDGCNDLANICRRFAKEGDEASRLGLIDRVDEDIDQPRRPRRPPLATDRLR